LWAFSACFLFLTWEKILFHPAETRNSLFHKPLFFQWFPLLQVNCSPDVFRIPPPSQIVPHFAVLLYYDPPELIRSHSRLQQMFSQLWNNFPDRPRTRFGFNGESFFSFLPSKFAFLPKKPVFSFPHPQSDDTLFFFLRLRDHFV